MQRYRYLDVEIWTGAGVHCSTCNAGACSFVQRTCTETRQTLYILVLERMWDDLLHCIWSSKLRALAHNTERLLLLSSRTAKLRCAIANGCLRSCVVCNVFIGLWCTSDQIMRYDYLYTRCDEPYGLMVHRPDLNKICQRSDKIDLCDSIGRLFNNCDMDGVIVHGHILSCGGITASSQDSGISVQVLSKRWRQ